MNDALNALRRSWLDYAGTAGADVPGLPAMIDEQLVAADAAGPVGETQLMAVVEDLSSYLANVNRVALIPSLTKRFRQATYEYLLSLDAFAAPEANEPETTSSEVAPDDSESRTGDMSATATELIGPANQHSEDSAEDAVEVAEASTGEAEVRWDAAFEQYVPPPQEPVVETGPGSVASDDEPSAPSAGGGAAPASSADPSTNPTTRSGLTFVPAMPHADFAHPPSTAAPRDSEPPDHRAFHLGNPQDLVEQVPSEDEVSAELPMRMSDWEAEPMDPIASSVERPLTQVTMDLTHRPTQEPPEGTSRVDAETLRKRVHEKLKKKRCDEAASMLQELAQTVGGRSVAETALQAGDRCRSLGKKNAGLNCYLAAARADPVYPDPLARLADICIDDDDIDLAVSYLERIARIHELRAETAEALQAYRKIVTIAPYREDILEMLMRAQTGGRLR